MNLTLTATDYREMLAAAKLAMTSASELNKLSEGLATMLGAVRLTVTTDGRHVEVETMDREMRLIQRLPLAETGTAGTIHLAFADLAAARPDRNTTVRIDHAPLLHRFRPGLPTTQIRHVRGGHTTVAEIHPIEMGDGLRPDEPLPGPEDYGCMLPASTIAALIGSLVFQSRDETRAVLNGAYLDPKTSHVVATDGRRLIRYRTKTTPHPCILPTHACSILAALKPATATAAVREPEEPGRSATFISLKFGRYTLHTPCVDGYFPNHQAVTPRQEILTSSITFADPAGVASWLSTLKPTAKAESVTLTPRLPHHVDIVHPHGRITATAHLEGEPQPIAFNPAFLADCLATLGGTLFLTDEISPGVFKKGDGLAVLMPLRLAPAATNENTANAA